MRRSNIPRHLISDFKINGNFDKRVEIIKIQIDHVIKVLKERKDPLKEHWSWWIFPNSVIANQHKEFNMKIQDYQKIIEWKNIQESEINSTLFVKFFFAVCKTIIFNLLTKNVDILYLMGNVRQDVGKFLAAVHAFYLCFNLSNHNKHFKHFFELVFTICRFQNRIEDVLSEDYNTDDQFISVQDKDKVKILFKKYNADSTIESLTEELYSTAADKKKFEDKVKILFKELSDKLTIKSLSEELYSIAGNKKKFEDKVKILFKKYNVDSTIESLTEKLYSMAINIKKLDCKIYDVDQQDKKVEDSEYNIEFILEVDQEIYYCNFNNNIFHKLNIFTKKIKSLDCSKNHCFKKNKNNLEKLSKVNPTKQKISYYKINI